jgi:hypothetical protein
MSEEVGAILCGQFPHELPDTAMQFLLASRGAFAQKCLERAIGQLDRIEVG